MQICKTGWKYDFVSILSPLTFACAFQIEREVEIAGLKNETEISRDDGTVKISTKFTSKVLENVLEASACFQMVLFSGFAPSAEIGSNDHTEEIFSHRSEQVLTFPHSSNPYPKNSSEYLDLDVTYLLRNLLADPDSPLQLRWCARINRLAADCKTPRRNSEVEAAEKFFTSTSAFFRQIYIRMTRILDQAYSNMFRTPTGQQLTPTKLPWNQVEVDIFSPVAPVILRLQDGNSAEMVTATSAVQPQSQPQQPPSVILDVGSVGTLLTAQKQSLDSFIGRVVSLLPIDGASSSSALLGQPEAVLIACALHTEMLSKHSLEALEYVENMLEKQLVAAIGKRLTPKDFTDYTRFHNKRLLREEYRPKSFSYSIRRTPNHSPEGTVRIEELSVEEKGDVDPVETIVRKCEGESAEVMQLPLSASTVIRFGGVRYLHALLMHAFSTRADQAKEIQLRLVAQARQFSCFAVVLGRISSATSFEPQHAFVVQNKDEIVVPLKLQQIPTAKEFRKAVSTLSNEQRSLAEAFRSLQLQSTLFGVCVVQIKPHLEQVLQLPHDSLTKEIRLTQQLMTLFTEHQIPSDQLSCTRIEEGDEDRVEEVRESVGSILTMIQQAKDEEVAKLEQSKKVL